MWHGKWREYLTWERSQLTERLSDAWRELAGLYEERATTQQAYLSAKVDGYWRSSEQSVSGREREAERIASPNRNAVYDVEGQIAALEAERDFLLWLLAEGGSHAG